ncbi:NUDIX hydrolase [Kordiimonas aestuarii]|uniref:NUDIX hydrolase n=1 Tax=Kordiimonas aestuarii TaxID=1005925 RepID=UPI0021D292E6|nr:NUDIX hydrolase [Kordiimonas aestuarii]
MAKGIGIPDSFEKRIPEGDERERLVCTDCGFIHYENPRIIAGAVVEHAGRILLCRRAIFPQKGRWTIPAGYLENGEAPHEGAAREVYEEALAEIEITDLLAVYAVKHISQVHLMYRATLKAPDFGPGTESLEVALFDWQDIPWDELAFPSVHWVLNHHREVRGKTGFAPFTNPVGSSGRIKA